MALLRAPLSPFFRGWLFVLPALIPAGQSYAGLCWKCSPTSRGSLKSRKKIVLKIPRNTSALCSVGHTTVSITRYQLWTKMRRLYIAQPYCFVRDTGQMGSQPVWKQKYIWKCNYLNKHFHTKIKVFWSFQRNQCPQGKEKSCSV